IAALPRLEIARENPKAAPPEPIKPEQPPLQLGADAFHPRQRIFTDPLRPTHPRQTLINPMSPMEPPKWLTVLPNIVLFQQLAGPAKPRLGISEEMLQKLHP